MLEMHGVSRLLTSFNDVLPGYVFGGVYFSDRYISGHFREVKAFLRGLVRAFRFIRDHEEQARKHIPEYTGVSEAVAMRSALRDLSGNGRENTATLARQMDLLVKFGFLERKVSFETIIDYRYLPRF